MRLRLLPLALVSVLLPLGCADEVDNVEPRDGTWNYYAEGTENNTCPSIVVFPHVDGVMPIDYDSGATFDIDYGTGDDVHCNISGDHFVCPERLYAEEPSADAELTVQWFIRIEGTFLSEVEAEGRQEVRVDCEGEDCVVIDDEIPCVFDLPFHATAIVTPG